jgi:hypothetical protein
MLPVDLSKLFGSDTDEFDVDDDDKNNNRPRADKESDSNLMTKECKSEGK